MPDVHSESSLYATRSEEVSEKPMTLSVQVDLLAAIHERIIPQLVLAHAVDPLAAALCVDTRPPPTPEEVAEFAEISVTQDLSVLLAYVEEVIRQGVSLDVVLLNLITPTAYHLGEQWEEDERSFADVTLGLVKLQQVVNVIGPRFSPLGSGARGSVVLACPLHEQHTLGLQVLGEFMRRADWRVQVAPELTSEDLLDLVANEHIDVVGISVKNSDCFDALRILVRDLKKLSSNSELLVMVGGDPTLADHASEMGCSYCADANAAVRWLDQYANTSYRNAG